MANLMARLVLAVSLIFVVLPEALAAKRVALVIGNSGYQHASHLPNPVNDAADIAAVLQRLGFDVRKEHDLDYRAMRRALRDFSRLAARAEFAVVFYAGHGMEVNKHNYVIPVDAELKSDLDVQFEAVPLDLVLHAVDGAQKLKLVLLDACRNNPFTASMKMTSGKRAIGRGLARVEPGVGTLVSYAAKEGTTADDGAGRNSPYTAALLKHLEEPRLEINFLFRKVRDSVMAATNERQQPFTYGSLPGEKIYLTVPGARPATASSDSSDLQQQLAALREELRQRDESISQFAELKTMLERQQAEFEKLKQQTEKAKQKLANVPSTSQSAPDGVQTPQELFTIANAEAKKGNHVLAVELWRQAALKDHAGAMYNLGIAYERGEGVEKNPSEAFRWFSNAADKGDRDGLFKTGEAYHHGRGVGKNINTAFDWYRKAAAKDHVAAMHSIALMYADGSGVSRDYKQALRWSRKAADAGHASSMNLLGVIYRRGLGVSRDDRESVHWYRKAAEKGLASAMYNLGNMYEKGAGVSRSYKEAVSWYRKAAEGGLASAMYNVGVMYLNGRGVDRDYREAVHWTRKAADKGDPDAMHNLGAMYDRGHGVARDHAEAARWMARALEQGHDFSVKQMASNSRAWNRQFRRELQKILRDEGYYKGSIDGAFGSGTLQAIRRYAGKN